MNIFRKLFAANPANPAQSRQAQMRVLTQETATYSMEEALGALANVQDIDAVLLKAGIGRDKLRVLEFDDEISAALETRRDAITAMPWRIEPALDSGRAGKKAAAAMWAMLEHMMPSIMRSAWDAVPYGYSVIECVYTQNDGIVTLERATGKPLEWFMPQRDGRLVYMADTGARDVVDTRFKFILTLRASSYIQPYGEALLSRLYWPWYLRQEGWKMWARHLERHGSPMLVGKLEIPKSDRPLTEPEQAAQQDAINAALSGLAAALDRAVRSATVASTADISAINPGNAGEAFNAFNAAIDKRIQKAVLGQTLTSDVGSYGSYAAAKVHDSVRTDKRNADLKLVGGAVQKIINAIADLNGWPRPVFDWMLESELEEARAARDAVLANAGIASFSRDYLLRVYDFEDSDLAPSPTMQKPAVQAASDSMALQFASNHDEPTRFTAGQQAVENQVYEALRETRQPLDITHIRSAIMGADSPEDLEQRLAVLLDKQDPDYADLLARAQFAASVLGYINAEEGRV